MAIPSPAIIKVSFGGHVVNLALHEKIGEGAFATVFKAFDERGRSFAVKKIECRSIECQQSVNQEIGVLLGLTHPNVIKLYAMEYLGQSLAAFLVMEYCENGTLNDRLNDAVVNAALNVRWMCQLANALEHLHSHNIVHRDLKPDNVLVNGNDDLKISDFGVARSFVCMRGGGSVLEEASGYISQYLDAYMGTFAGTPYWIAPEVFDHVYNEKADVFSLGIIFYAITERQSCVHDGKRYFGCFLKHGREEVGIGVKMYETRQEICPEFALSQINKRVTQLLCEMLRYNFHDRPDALNVCSELNEISLNDLTNLDLAAPAASMCQGRCLLS